MDKGVVDWDKISPMERLRRVREEQRGKPTRKKPPRVLVGPEATEEELVQRLSTATTLAEKTQAVHQLEQRRDRLIKHIAVAGSPTERLKVSRRLERVRAALAGA